MSDFATLVLAADTKGLKNAERDLGSLSKSAAMNAQKIGASMKRLGLGLTVGVTAPLALFGKGAFQAAMDAQEMESAFNVVFGNMAGDVRAWAEETGNAMGRSTQEIQRGALAFQELFGKALDPKQAANLSKEFAVLTQDLASFKNLSNEVAQQKLFSGLTGEAEPLRAVGVFINDAAVQAKALELGLVAVNGKFTDQQKIVARAALIQEQLAQAQGDVLRTSDSTANQIKASQAAFEELQITIGTKLLPVLTPIIAGFGEMLTAFTQLPEPIQNATVVIGGLALVLGPILTVIGTIITIAPKVATAFGVIKAAALALMTNPVILGFAAVITGIYLAWQNWDKIEGFVSGVGDSISSFWNETAEPFFSDLGGSIKEGASQWWDWHKSAVQTFVEVHRTVFEYGVEIAMKVVSIGRDIVQGIVNGIKEAPGKVWEAMKSVVGFAVDKTKEFLGIKSPSLVFKEIGGFMAEGMAVGIAEGRSLVVEAVDELAEGAETQAVKVVDTFKEMAEGILGSLRNLSSAIKGGGFLDILGAVLDIGLQLAGAGVFGKKVQTNVNKPMPSFSGGGFTGFGARSGGLDGKGGFLAMMHPQESVIDHTRGGMGATGIRVYMDPSTATLGAFVEDRSGRVVAQAAPIIAQAGANAAGAQMAYSQRRQVRR